MTVAAAQSEHAITIAIVFCAVLVPLAVGLVAFAYRHRFRPVARQVELFAARFDGSRIVAFQPYFWSFDAATARRIAASRGYLEYDPSPHLPRAGAHRLVVTFRPVHPGR